MRKLIISIIIISNFSLALATGQEAERIIYKNTNYSLFNNPLEMYFKNNKIKRPNFNNCSIETYVCVERSSNWRGYTGTWEIIDNNLFLNQIQNLKSELVNLNELFGTNQEGKIKATWFTGKLKIQKGKILKYVRMGYGTIYEYEIVFEMYSGQVVNKILIDNTEKEIPSMKNIVTKELIKAVKTGLLKKTQ